MDRTASIHHTPNAFLLTATMHHTKYTPLYRYHTSYTAPHLYRYHTSYTAHICTAILHLTQHTFVPLAYILHSTHLYRYHASYTAHMCTAIIHLTQHTFVPLSYILHSTHLFRYHASYTAHICIAIIHLTHDEDCIGVLTDPRMFSQTRREQR